MFVAAGTRLGPYQVLELIGAGGMGEVYRARDTRLDRAVAIKVLPAGISADPERRARFDREAKTIAGLKHPHICTLYDVGEHDGSTFFVMEHLEGETLAQRLERGPLPIDQALAIATQTADALATAHRQGVVHRDLKPGNVMLTKAGAKLLDFGVARLSARGGQAAPASMGSVATRSLPVTGEGVIVGTLQYMAPEQLEGKETDARSDLFAFGAVLYEMVTGRQAFNGSSPASVISAILSAEPDPMPSIVPMTPPSLHRLVTRCLAKDPDERWDTAHDVADELRWIARGAGEGVEVARPLGRGRTAVVMAAVGAAGLLAGGAAVWMSRPAPPPAIVTRSEVAVHPADRLDSRLSPGRETGAFARTRGGASKALAMAPDGASLVFVGLGGGVQRLYLRPMAGTSATPLSGTEGAQNPAFSPDGAWVAFWANGWLKKIPSGGGTVVPLVASRQAAGISWGPDNRIICGTLSDGLWRVAADGGAVERLTELRSDEVSHRLPHVLPGGKWVLFTVRRSRWLWGDAQIVAQSLNSAERKVILDNAVAAVYVPSGHLLYMQAGTLMARPFDPDALSFTGGAAGVVDSVSQAIAETGSEQATGAGHFAASSSGTLAYVAAGPGGFVQSRFVSVDRRGSVTELPTVHGTYIGGPKTSDGDRIVVSVRGPQECVLWLLSRSRGAPVPLTNEGEAMWPLWTPDGKRIVFLWRAGGSTILARVDPDRAGEPERLLTTGAAASLVPASWAQQGRVLAVSAMTPDNLYDIDLLVIGEAGATIQPLIRTKYNERSPEFSPSGRWLAYVSNESGRDQVYVQAYPGQGQRIPVSTDGGHNPAWNPNERELFFLSGESETGARSLMAVDFNGDRVPPVGVVRKLFDVTAGFRSSVSRTYDVFPDGQHFLGLDQLPDPEPPPVTRINLVQNWFEELRAKAPAAK